MIFLQVHNRKFKYVKKKEFWYNFNFAYISNLKRLKEKIKLRHYLV